MPHTTQIRYSRLAGFLFLIEIVLALLSGVILSHIGGSGTFAEAAGRIAASEHPYRAALTRVVVVTLASAVLAFALYATLEPVNPLLAQLAMIFSLGDSFLGMVVRTCGFVRVHLYTSAKDFVGGTIAAETLSDLMRSMAGSAESIGGIAFGIGSLPFFYLFFKSNYIPRLLSGLGMAASVVWTCLYLAALVYPERHPLFQYVSFPPLVMADVITGLYLVLNSLRARA